MRVSSLAAALVAAATLVHAQQPPAVKQSSATPQEKPAPKTEIRKSPADPAPKPKPIPPEDLWLYPAQRLSASIESDAWRIRRDLHAIGFATLSAAWWKLDRSAAEHWMYPAVDEVAIGSQDEAAIDRVRRLEAARRVLALVTPIDVILRERLKDTVKNAADRVTEFGPGVRWQTADALVDAVENGTPSDQAGAISEALQYTVTSSTVLAIDALRESMPADAERLFTRALSRAMSSNDPEEMRAFMPLLTDDDTPAQWRQQISNAYTRALGNGNLDPMRRCVLASESAGSEELGTEVQQAIAATAAECMRGFSDPVRDTDTQLLQRADPKTSDDYLAVAGQSRSPISRYHVKLTAAEKAEKEDLESGNGGPIRALGIFDGMTTDERAVNPGEYKRLRTEEAIKASLVSLGKSGCSAGLRIVDSSPRETILHIAIGVAEKITTSNCFQPAMDLVMRQVGRVQPEDPDDYYRIINLAVRHGRYPEQMLQEVLRAMDGWKPKNPKTVAPTEIGYQAGWNELRPMPIAAELFNIGAEKLSAMARGCRNDLLRTDFELFLVRGFLDRYARDLAKQKEEMKAEAEKP